MVTTFHVLFIYESLSSYLFIGGILKASRSYCDMYRKCWF